MSRKFEQSSLADEELPHWLFRMWAELLRVSVVPIGSHMLSVEIKRKVISKKGVNKW